jgi:hypothetical protein
MMSSNASTLPPRLSIAPDVYFSPPTEQGCIVLNLERGTVLSLNDTGTLMFSKIAERNDGVTRDELVTTVRQEFENVEVFRLENAVDDLLAQLKKTGTLKTTQNPPQIKGWDFRSELALRVPTCIRHLLRPLLIVKAYTCAALILLFTAEVVRKLGGFRSIQQTVERWKLQIQPRADQATLANACSAVNRACTWHPKRALCLQRASVLVCLLRSLGFPAEMVIGVHKTPFYGHAWAEVGGQVVNDHSNAQKFFQVLNRC